MNFKEYRTKYFTQENITAYKAQAEKLVFVSDLTGLSVDHCFADRLDKMFWNATEEFEKIDLYAVAKDFRLRCEDFIEKQYQANLLTASEFIKLSGNIRDVFEITIMALKEKDEGKRAKG